jgi:ABC-type bacteriocin/lantibiotic exporter with double-glycine peptidase domain
LRTLSRFARRIGFRTEGAKVSYDAIAGCELPAIAHLRRLWWGHFVVLQRWGPTHVLLADPARGARRLSRRTFCRRSSGYLLIVHPPTRPIGSSQRSQRDALRTHRLS